MIMCSQGRETIQQVITQVYIFPFE
uniref:Uncharacterized protein n=1 Tax=Arundo donax TaxID=35708 RepID=A0A0A8ZGZ0_ARUDO